VKGRKQASKASKQARRNSLSFSSFVRVCKQLLSCSGVMVVVVSVVYSQNADDPQENFSQIWLQAKYEIKLFYKKKSFFSYWLPLL
jgi:hypothetical protein